MVEDQELFKCINETLSEQHREILHKSSEGGCPYLAIYFGASWSKPCIEFSNQIRKLSELLRDQVLVLIVSMDIDKRSHKNWALKFPECIHCTFNHPLLKTLRTRFKIDQIPELVLIHLPSFKVSNISAREAVLAIGVEGFPWILVECSILDSVSLVHLGKEDCCVLFLSSTLLDEFQLAFQEIFNRLPNMKYFYSVFGDKIGIKLAETAGFPVVKNLESKSIQVSIFRVGEKNIVKQFCQFTLDMDSESSPKDQISSKLLELVSFSDSSWNIPQFFKSEYFALPQTDPAHPRIHQLSCASLSRMLGLITDPPRLPAEFENTPQFLLLIYSSKHDSSLELRNLLVRVSDAFQTIPNSPDTCFCDFDVEKNDLPSEIHSKTVPEMVIFDRKEDFSFQAKSQFAGEFSIPAVVSFILMFYWNPVEIFMFNPQFREEISKHLIENLSQD